MYFYVAENLLFPFITFSIESNKSLSEIAFLLALIANIPASVHTLLRSAPTINSFTCRVGTQSGQHFEPYIFLHAHRSSMNLENLGPSFQIRKSELNFSVKSSWSAEGRVQSVRSVSSHEYFNISSVLKTVHLVHNLEHGSLDFIVRARSIVVSGSADRVDFIKKYNTSFFGSGQLENFTHHASSFSHILLHQF